MKRYIIIGTFFDMGGGQLYTRNKTDFLKKNGWVVDVYTGRSGKLYLDDMKMYEDNYYRELNHIPFYTSVKRQKQIIREIAGDISQYNEIVIESHKQPFALWGEMLAQYMQAKHVFFDLDEDFVEFEEWYYDFLDFKYERRELAGINNMSMQKMFKAHREIAEGKNYYLKFSCGNSICDINNDIIESAEEVDINLGSISRLNKDYIMPMMKEIALFAQNNLQKNIALFIVGDCDDKTIELKIKEIFSKIKNLKVYFLGYLSPIPQVLIDKVDYFIGTSGSACLTAAQKKVTITIDTMNAAPIGIMGVDAANAVFADGKCGYERLSDYLQHICIEESKEEIRDKICLQDELLQNDYMKEFKNHMKFIEESENKKNYYNFQQRPLKHRAFCKIVSILGIDKCINIRNFLTMKLKK